MNWRVRRNRVVFKITIAMSLIILTHGLILISSDNIEVLPENDLSKSFMSSAGDTLTCINLTMSNNNSLCCEINNASIKTNTAQRYINLSNLEWFREPNLELNAFKFNDSLSYIQYSNQDNTHNKEIVLSKNSFNEVDISEFNRGDSRRLYINKPNNKKVASTTLLNTYLIMSETSTVSNIDDINFGTMLSQIEDNLYITKANNLSGIELRLNNIGVINIKGDMEVTYLKPDGVLKIHSIDKDEDYCYISCINNNVVEYVPNEFEPTSINNVYTSLRDTETPDLEYKTMAILGESELFIFRINKNYSEAIETNILTQLNLI